MAKSKVEIIQETVKYYSTHKRGVSADYNCYYFTPGDVDCMCAVGRCMTRTNEKVMEMVMDAKNGKARVEGIGGIATRLGNLDNGLKPSYRGHDRQFWEDLQNLHDSTTYWERGKLGLNDHGKIYVEQLISRWKD